jgi:hypothetical protein
MQSSSLNPVFRIRIILARIRVPLVDPCQLIMDLHGFQAAKKESVFSQRFCPDKKAWSR